MERNEKMNWVLTKAQKKARLCFAVKHQNLDWSRVVFMGINEASGIKMWGAVSEFDGCAFRAVVSLKTHQYVSFLETVIFSMWNKNKKLIFMQVRKCQLIRNRSIIKLFLPFIRIRNNYF